MNIVLIVADDLGWSDLGCCGSVFYETPQLDGLAEEGVRFTDAYATCPVCSPSRASLMTGKYPARLGLTAHIGETQPKDWRRDTPLKPASYVNHLSLEETTLAERLHDAGYATLHAGKWHLGGEKYWPEYQGFDVNIGGWSSGGPFGGKKYFSPYGNPRLKNGPEGEHLADRLADEAARFIESRRHKPFFVYLPFYSVHVPLVAKQQLEEKYAKKLASLPSVDNKFVETADGKERKRQDHVTYAAMVEAMDTAIGRVLKALDDAGVADHTVVLFTSDNGGLATGDCVIPPEEGWPTTNAPLRAGKGWLYEGGTRVPLIVRTPKGACRGAVSNRVVTGADFYPSVVELAGLELADGEAPDGQSFVPSLFGDAERRGPVYWHYPHYGNQGGRPGGAIRDGDWKLIEWYGEYPETAKVELYDLANDIGESEDLSGAYSARREAMLSDLRSWRATLDAQMPTPNPESEKNIQALRPTLKAEALHK